MDKTKKLYPRGRGFEFCSILDGEALKKIKIWSNGYNKKVKKIIFGYLVNWDNLLLTINLVENGEK